MADEPQKAEASARPQTILASPASSAYFGPGVIDFLNRNSGSFRTTIVATPMDHPDMRGTPQEQATRAEQFNAVLAQSGAAMPERLRAGIIEDVGNLDSRAFIAAPGPPVPVIVVAEVGRSGQEIFNSYAGLPPTAPTQVPGSVQDWRAMTLFHEQSHHNHNHAPIGRNRNNQEPRGSPLRDEYEGDHGGAALYQQAHREGVVSSAGVPDALTAARLIRAFLKPADNGDYSIAGLRNTATAEGLNKPHATEANDAASAAREDLKTVKYAVYTEAIRQQDPDAYARIRAQVMYEEFAKADPKSEISIAMKKLIDDARPGNRAGIESLKDILSQMPDNNPNVTEAVRLRCAQAFGESLGAPGGSPYTSGLAAAAAVVAREGEFSANASAQSMLTSFVSAAQTYAGAVFNKPVPAPTVAPKISVPESISASTAPLEPIAPAAKATGIVMPKLGQLDDAPATPAAPPPATSPTAPSEPDAAPVTASVRRSLTQSNGFG